MIKLILIFVFLFIIEIVYLKIARLKNIKDTPNIRSAHVVPTIRGGGIIFIFGILLFSLFYPINKELIYFILSASIVAIISFIDDLISLSSKIRIFFHLLAFVIIFYGLGLFDIHNFNALILLVVVFILSLGFLNIYNFMDGINGITFLNSLITFGALLYVNEFISKFTSSELLLVMVLASLVFGFFNFRKKAICFAGDIGSITIGFTLIYFMIKLYFSVNNLMVFLFLSVYLLDGGWTIFERLIRRENIFKAHKRHYYQLLANDFKYPHLLISLSYFVVQLIITVVAIILLSLKVYSSMTAVVIFLVASILYSALKISVIKKIEKV